MNPVSLLPHLVCTGIFLWKFVKKYHPYLRPHPPSLKRRLHIQIPANVSNTKLKYRHESETEPGSKIALVGERNSMAALLSSSLVIKGCK